MRALKKPVVSAWAIDLLAHRNRERLERLVELWDELGTARDPSELRRLSDDRRRLISELSHSAAQLLRDAGHEPASSTMHRVERNLYSVGDPETRDDVLAGRLSEDLPTVTLQPLGIATDASRAAEPERPNQRLTDLREELEEARLHAEEMQRRATAARNEAARAEHEVERAIDRIGTLERRIATEERRKT